MPRPHRSDFGSWVERYIHAWNTNDRGDIGALFADDAVYLTSPLAGPWNGREHIVESWLEIKDEPGSWKFTYDVIAVDGNLGVVQGRATYFDPQVAYGNLWLIRLTGDGRCTSFTEYWTKENR
jgi:ketosteroid isomerase-like protein